MTRMYVELQAAPSWIQLQTATYAHVAVAASLPVSSFTDFFMTIHVLHAVVFMHTTKAPGSCMTV